MSCLYQRGGVWWGDFTDRNGRRIRKSTKVRDKKAAGIIVAQWVKDDEYARAGLMPIDPKWRDLPLKTHVDDWCAAMIADKPEEGERRYVKQSKAFLQRTFDANGWRVLSDLSRDGIDRMFDKMATVPTRRGEMPTPKTRHDRRSTLHSFLEWCRECGRIVDNPCKAPRGDKSVQSHRRAMTPEEVRKLLTCQKISTRRRLSYLVMLATGLRRTPAMFLTPEMLRLDAPECRAVYIPALVWVRDRHRPTTTVSLTVQGGDEWVCVRLDKARKGLEIPVAEPVARVLEILAKGLRPDQPILARNLEARTFKADLIRAEIPIMDDRGHQLVLHSTRKTANSLMAADGVNTAARAGLLSWSDPRLADVTYLDQRSLPKADAAERLGRIVTQAVPLNDEIVASLSRTIGVSNAGDRNRTCTVDENRVAEPESIVPVVVPVSDVAKAVSLLLTEEYVGYVRGESFILVPIRPPSPGDLLSLVTRESDGKSGGSTVPTGAFSPRASDTAALPAGGAQSTGAGLFHGGDE